MGIARYAQKRTRRSARRVEIKEKYSLSARKETNAKKAMDTRGFTTIAKTNTPTIIHQLLTRWRSSVKLESGFHQRRISVSSVAKSRSAKSPPRAQRVLDVRSVPINAEPPARPAWRGSIPLAP